MGAEHLGLDQPTLYACITPQIEHNLYSTAYTYHVYNIYTHIHTMPIVYICMYICIHTSNTHALNTNVRMYVLLHTYHTHSHPPTYPHPSHTAHTHTLTVGAPRRMQAKSATYHCKEELPHKATKLFGRPTRRASREEKNWWTKARTSENLSREMGEVHY